MPNKLDHGPTSRVNICEGSGDICDIIPACIEHMAINQRPGSSTSPMLVAPFYQ